MKPNWKDIFLPGLLALFFILPTFVKAEEGIVAINAKKTEVLSKIHLDNLIEIRASEMALEKSSSPEVKRLAQKLRQDHQKADELALAVAQDVGAQVLILTPTTQQILMLTKLQELTGEEFDKSFVQSMIESHEKSIAHLESVSSELAIEAPVVHAFIELLLPKLKLHLQLAQDLKERLTNV